MDTLATKAIIDTKIFTDNLRYFRSLIGKNTKLCLTAKANAYGHGLIAMSRIAAKLVDCFAVATVDEGVQLRENGITNDIYVMSPHLREAIPLLCIHTLRPFVSHARFIPDYQREAKRHNMILPIHLKIDSGMGRAGVMPQDALLVARDILVRSHLRLEGLCTHFACADHSDKTGITRTKSQLALFETVVNEFSSTSVPLLIHAANSAACISYPQSHYSMVRIGIGAYGYAGKAKPALRFVTKIGIVKRIPKGYRVSYGGTWRARRESIIAVLPVGYGDGYSRLLSNNGMVRVGTRQCPVIGRVSMDQTVIDVTDLGSAPDTLLEKGVALFGNYKNLNAATIAQQCKTIPYEILTSISHRVPRVYV